MARPKVPARVSGNRPRIVTASAAMSYPGKKVNPKTDRAEIAKPWQVEAYRQVNICGEARYAATLFANLAARAEIGVSKPQVTNGKAVWITQGPEVDAFAELAPTVRERTKLIRDFMTHYIIAGECYLIARDRRDNDPGYIPPPDGFDGTWEEYIASRPPVDLFNREQAVQDPNHPVWEVVAVTELMKVGSTWKVRYDNGNYVELNQDDPVIRMWNPDPSDRREAWSPFRSMLATLREIEWLTKHIFTQVRSRLMSAGVWFLPNNLTFPPPPANMVDGGAEAIATMNEAEQFMLSLAASSMGLLEDDDVAFPSVVMADQAALAAIDKEKLIQFWSEIDDKAMTLRSSAVRRFALGMDLPPEQILGSSGIAIDGSGGSAGSVNHWGEWANEEKTIAGHVEPALETFVSTLTNAVLRPAVEGTANVIAYDPSSIRMKQDRSKDAMEWFDRGILKADVALREGGFDPAASRMDPEEFKRWLLVKIAGGSATPEQVNEALRLLGIILNVPQEGSVSGNQPAPGQPGRNNAPSLQEHPVQGPPREDHEHNDAPFSARHAAAEVLVLRALEKAGARLLNQGKRGKDRDRYTPPHLAHVLNEVSEVPDFDFSLASEVYGDLPASARAEKERQLAEICRGLYETGTPYTRAALMDGLGD